MAIIAKDAIRIEGLKEFLARMQQADVELPRKVIKEALNGAAALVVEDARGRAPVKTGALRESIKVSSTATFARVSEGSAKVPYAGFIDYGGTVGRYRTGNIKGLEGDARNVHRLALRAHTARHFAVRPFVPTGRILFPAFMARKMDVLTMMSTTMRDAMNSVGIAVDE